MSQVAAILDSRDQRISDIKQRAAGFETEADRREIAKINAESDDQINALLADGENRLLQVEKFKRTDLGKAVVEHFGATPDELAAISDHEKAMADVLATPGGDLEGVQARSLEKLEKIVGHDRKNEFMSYRDPAYVEVLNFMKRFNFPPETAVRLMNLRAENGRIVLDRLKQKNFSPDPVRTEAFRARVKELLGAEAGEIYIREAKGGLWLR